MIYRNFQQLVSSLGSKNWDVVLYKKTDPKEGTTCIGAVARLSMSDQEDFAYIVLPFEHYHSPRAYLESIVKDRAILRSEGCSIPTDRVTEIIWMFLYGPKKDFPPFFKNFSKEEESARIDHNHEHLTHSFRLAINQNVDVSFA